MESILDPIHNGTMRTSLASNRLDLDMTPAGDCSWSPAGGFRVPGSLLHSPPFRPNTDYSGGPRSSTLMEKNDDSFSSMT